MELYVLDTKDPYLNLAIEEYLFRNSTDSIFILWQNDNAVVIGKNQNAYCEINTEYAKSKNIKIARRITGGGAVYHDLGNINYSFISKSSNNEIDFKTFTEPIISLLQSLGINAELSGRNDILVGEKKISGNAQFSSNGRVLHHGTLLFDSDLSVLSGALNVDPEKIKSKAIKSTRSRVTNIKELLKENISAKDFIHFLSKYIIDRFSAKLCDIPINDEISSLAKRNASDEWLFPKRDFLSSYTLKKKKRFDFGTVEIDLEMYGDVIRNVKIHGDFFGNEAIESLESIIVGTSIGGVKSKIADVKISSYVHGMTNEEFVNFIIE